MADASRLKTNGVTSRRMSLQRRRDTGCELAVRTLLHRLGLRYRVDYQIPDRPRARVDVAFTRMRVAVFLDGCFWHACPDHATWPKSNGEWWKAKLEKNRNRDIENAAALTDAGWTVVRGWEHEDPITVIGRILTSLRRD